MAKATSFYCRRAAGGCGWLRCGRFRPSWRQSINEATTFSSSDKIRTWMTLHMPGVEYDIILREDTLSEVGRYRGTYTNLTDRLETLRDVNDDLIDQLEECLEQGCDQ